MPCEQRTMSANEFSKLVFAISQQLKCSDVEALKYLYRVTTDEGVSTLGVLRILEKRGVFSSGNIKGLRTLLCNIDRCDLLDMLKIEDKRLALCYFQAVSIETQLEAIRADLMRFSAKQECSPTERSFCGKIADRVVRIQGETKDYLIRPLNEMQEINTG